MASRLPSGLNATPYTPPLKTIASKELAAGCGVTDREPAQPLLQRVNGEAGPGGYLRSIRTDSHAPDVPLVLGIRPLFQVAQPLDVIPLQPAKLLGTCVEQAVGHSHMIGPPLAVGTSDDIGVELPLERFGLLGRLAGRLPGRAQGLGLGELGPMLCYGHPIEPECRQC